MIHIVPQAFFGMGNKKAMPVISGVHTAVSLAFGHKYNINLYL